MTKAMIDDAMLEVAREMNRVGIAKDKVTAAAGKYKYRGIDQVLNALAAPLVAAHITVAPSYQLISHQEHKTKDGVGMLSVVAGSITFYAIDGSSRTVGPFIGEAFDSFDKSISKASSVAYRNGMFLTFVIPLGPGYDPEEDEEPDQTQESVDKRTESERSAKPGEVVEGGIHLSKSQTDWLMRKLDQHKCSEKELFKTFPRVDATNIERVAAWLAGG
jgi:hypothetical protein